MGEAEVYCRYFERDLGISFLIEFLYQLRTNNLINVSNIHESDTFL